MRLYASVGEFDHGMNSTLGLNHDLDAVVGHLEQMVRLDNLKTLVHKGG